MNILNWFQEPKKIGFEDLLQYMKNKNNNKESKIILINTLNMSEQEYLILHTISCHTEETLINGILKKLEEINYTIIIYGKHALDETTKIKYKQLNNLGFQCVYIYYGGLFEWSLLQEVYSAENFPTTMKCRDLLYYSPHKVLLQNENSMGIKDSH